MASSVFSFADLPLTVEQAPYKGDLRIRNDEKSIKSRSDFLKKHFSWYEGVNQITTLPLSRKFETAPHDEP